MAGNNFLTLIRSSKGGVGGSAKKKKKKKLNGAELIEKDRELAVNRIANFFPWPLWLCLQLQPDVQI